MSFGDRLGIAGVVLALLAIAISSLWPDKRWIGQVGFGLAFLMLVGWSTWEIRQKWSGRMAFALALIVGAAFGAISAAVIWQSSAIRKPGNAATKVDRQLKLYVDAELTVTPVRLPPNGILNVMQLQPNAQANVIGSEVTKGGDSAWTDLKGFVPRIYTCKVTNYGAETVVNVTIKIHVTFSRMVDAGGGQRRSEAPRFDADCPFVIAKIDPGVNNAYVFYMGNFWDEFVTVRWPDSATAATVGDSTISGIPLAHPLGQLFFPAFENAVPKHSAAPNPTTSYRTAYRTFGAVKIAVDTLMKIWMDRVIAGKTTLEQEEKVRSAFNTYKVAMIAAGSAVLSDDHAAPPDLTAVADALSNQLATFGIEKE
jgi:hypothetical protein